ncbi:MAG TPA: hypothetical protein VGE68_04495 [Sphingomicrobium sp.]
MWPDDSDYYRARAIEERWQMKDAERPIAAQIHAELALHYDRLADRLETPLDASDETRAV